ncbi:MAG: sulfurtransferase [Hyphomicrobiales bacterium]|nr:sulfurtransferase [Hyphomicrobiales bacterium]
MSEMQNPSVQPEHQLPQSNVTALELYATPIEAYAMWRADPGNVHVLDVRSFEEYFFGGHFSAAKNVPLVFPKFDPEGESLPGRPPGCSGEANPDFIPAVKAACAPDSVILVMCSTGGRAAMAVNLLAEAEFTKVYNVINGFEGDRVDDPGSVYHGKHMRNGWKNHGLPWGYDFDPDLMWVTRK